MKIFSIVMLCLIGLLILGMALYLIIGAICFKIALSRKSTAKRLVNKTMQKTFENYKIDFCWWEKFNFESLSLISKDGLKLVGHFLPNSSDKLAIIVHGYGADYREMQQYAKFFVEKNYNILVVENRAHGNSEGKMMGMGWLDKNDIVQWINFMIEKNPKFQIVLFGLSMGAATVCMTSGEQLPDNVKGVISDCAYDTVYNQFKYVFRNKSHLPTWPILDIFYFYLKTIYKFDIKQADAIKQIKKSKLRFLFIHGDSDTFVPTEMVYKLSGAVPDDRKSVYIAKGADHAMSYPVDPTEYERQLKAFLNKIFK